ncbi:hypothetical protein RYX36_003715 [Vicia faba]
MLKKGKVQNQENPGKKTNRLHNLHSQPHSPSNLRVSPIDVHAEEWKKEKVEIETFDTSNFRTTSAFIPWKIRSGPEELLGPPQPLVIPTTPATARFRHQICDQPRLCLYRDITSTPF